jgi:DeoR/GlpR family transcriptional regulator of sugar metabolism
MFRYSSNSEIKRKTKPVDPVIHRNERYESILTMLNRLKKVSVQELTRRFGVSEVTVRKDLSFLEERGKLIRIHGGAMLAEDEGRLRTIAVRQAEHTAEKRAIARKARELIRPGETIFIDAGSTCWSLAGAIRDMELRVVTNSLDAILALADAAGISLFSTGGSFRPDACSFIGPAALETIRSIQIETCFMGTTGFSRDGVFSSQNVIESQVKSAVIQASRRTVMLADHSKYGSMAFSVFARAEDVDILVTDSKIDAEAFAELGMEILVATAESN